MSTSDNAYQELARIFSTRNNRILEIEILPPTLGPLLQEDCSVGITKKYLVQAFVTARRIFFGNLRLSPECETLCATAQDENESSAQGASDKNLEDLLASTEIILLFDCEHLTACNWRRRRLDDLKRHHDLSPSDPKPLIQALETELTLMTTYLCSPLHRHTKSPTLWQHRIWLLKGLLQVRGAQVIAMRPQMACSTSQRTQSGQRYLEQESAINLLRSELDIVFRAGELHPRNYYAFSYMRQVHSILSDTMEIPETRAVLSESIIDSTLKWCLAHPSDISGWTYILHLLEAVTEGKLRLDTVNKVVRYALDVGWEGESLWTFIDLAAKAFDVEDMVSNTLQRTAATRFTTTIELSDGSTRAAVVSEPSWKSWLTMARAYWTNHNEVV
ncbi:hypothetical protein BDV28DRAFT_40627 [Aspergillus coremiiformis]|uniref:Protein prenylyltransferase n=1 Tax=Aspergillus coremiiformis TaxID=138285 RepID=A0A5N6YY41_9EURO|nr:hypothetical protein BDV28DRAFT_40627 [Aspergillus coremiiformis]